MFTQLEEPKKSRKTSTSSRSADSTVPSTHASIVTYDSTLPAVEPVLSTSIEPETSESSTSVDENGNYMVVEGDTLEDIAFQHQTTVDALILTNNLESTDINVGQILVIPQGE
nr:LysM peptidoglycan-binding domain-containing protein [Enterococcus sp. BWT-B8]